MKIFLSVKSNGNEVSANYQKQSEIKWNHWSGFNEFLWVCEGDKDKDHINALIDIEVSHAILTSIQYLWLWYEKLTKRIVF